MDARYPGVADEGLAGPEGEYLESCTALSFTEAEYLTEEFMRMCLGRLLAASYREPYLFAIHVMNRKCVQKILSVVKDIFRREETLVDVIVPHEGSVRVFGDIHGDIHSLAEALALTGLPGDNNTIVVAGDCIDRGSWGVEVFLYLFLLKIWKPKSVFLLRGNHETTGTICRYGFEEECMLKLGKKVLDSFTKVFRELPCAGLVRTLPSDVTNPSSADNAGPSGGGKRRSKRRNTNNNNNSNNEAAEWYNKTPLGGERRILIVHGGLFRAWTKGKKDSLELGTLHDLALSKRQLDDPIDCLIEDVLWSDPQVQHGGVCKNHLRGAGILFGKGSVENFYRRNKIHGLLRGHEGPDMREQRPEMDNMLSGHSVDLEVQDGFVATVFSTANYRTLRTYPYIFFPLC